MSPKEFAAKLTKLKLGLLPDGEGTSTIMRAACYGALAQIKQRIHGEGQAADNSDIGQYNKTTPLYVNPLNSPKSFKPLGKNAVYNIKEKKFVDFDNVHIEYKKVLKKGQHKFVNGKDRKTKYFPSYDAFKTEIGRNEIGKVNLFLFGGLSSQFTVIAMGAGFGLGWIPGEMIAEGVKKQVFSYYQRAKALELKYAKRIWGLSVAEKELSINAGQDAANKYFKNAIS